MVDFIDEPVPDYNNASIYALEKDITMKELLVPMIVVNSPEVLPFSVTFKIALIFLLL